MKNAKKIGWKQKTRIGVVMTVILAMPFAWGLPNAAEAADPVYGGTLTFGAEEEFAGFDVLMKGGIAICDAIANNTIQERLFDIGDGGELIPILGVSATPSEDGKIWTIKLREGVRFHDGAPFNADAVVQHWSRMLNPENRYRGRADIQPIESVEKIDEFSVRFRLAHPWAPFPELLAGARGLTTFIPSPKSVAEGTQLRAPVGTGPFMFKEWKAGDRFVVVKNPNYWQQGKPYLDEIIFKPVPDHQTRFASLKSGQMDMIWMDRGNIITQAEEDPALTHYQGEGNGAEIFILNTTQPPLDDVRVRQAIAHAWNQEACVKMSYKDAIPIAFHPFGDRLACGDAGYRKHDLQTAKQLVEAYGKPVEIECLHSNTQRGREQGEILQQFCKQIGVTVTPVGLAFSPVIKKVVTKDYQMSTWRISSLLDLGPVLLSSFHSKSPRNFSGYNDPEMDALLVAQTRETDPEKRKKLLCDIAAQINRDVPVIYRGGNRFHVLAKNEVKGVPEIKDGIVRLAETWLQR